MRDKNLCYPQIPFTTELLARLDEDAKLNKRSRNQQIVWILENYLDAQQTQTEDILVTGLDVAKKETTRRKASY